VIKYPSPASLPCNGKVAGLLRRWRAAFADGKKTKKEVNYSLK